MGAYIGNPTCCCGGGVCQCTCANCNGNEAPCCWKVVVSGIVDGSCASCDEFLNRTYYLEDDTGCSWSSDAICGVCDPSLITLDIVEEGGNYKIRVTLGAHVWEKNYGTTKPECCTLSSESLTHTTNSGDCDSSSATCVITSQGASSDCPQNCFQECFACLDDDISHQLLLIVSGIADQGGDCENTSVLNGSFVCTLGSGCVWSSQNFTTDPCDPAVETAAITWHWEVQANRLFFPTRNQMLAVMVGVQDTARENRFCKPQAAVTRTSPQFDCDAFSAYDLGTVGGVVDGCDVSGATMTITSL